MKLQKLVLLGVTAAALVLSGCVASTGGGTFARGETRRVMTVEYGTIESVRSVRIEGTRSGVGAVSGAVVGGIAGSTIGGGRGATIGTVLGATAGLAAGSAIESRVTSAPGVEVTVRLKNGQTIAVVQEDQGENFRPREYVRVVRDGATARVTR